MTRTYHIMTEVSLMASVKRLSALSAEHQKAVRDAAVDVVQGWYKTENMKVQEAAWQSLTQKMQANATPDVASFQAKMGPSSRASWRRSGRRGGSTSTPSGPPSSPLVDGRTG